MSSFEDIVHTSEDELDEFHNDDLDNCVIKSSGDSIQSNDKMNANEIDIENLTINHSPDFEASGTISENDVQSKEHDSNDESVGVSENYSVVVSETFNPTDSIERSIQNSPVSNEKSSNASRMNHQENIDSSNERQQTMQSDQDNEDNNMFSMRHNTINDVANSTTNASSFNETSSDNRPVSSSNKHSSSYENSNEMSSLSTVTNQSFLIENHCNDQINLLEVSKPETLQYTNASDYKNKINSSSSIPQNDELTNKLQTELTRLKQHLIQIEEDYTNELVAVQQREEILEQQLNEAKIEIEQLNARINNTGPLVAIRQQAEQALDERDDALKRCSKLEDEVQRSQASLANLQLVIERMQKEHDQRLQTTAKLHEQSLLEERHRYSQMESEINKYQLMLKESNNALQAAARLSQQLHTKQETIDQLRAHLKNKDELVGRLHDEINDLNSSCEGKVDKQFIKNLVVGYLNAPSDKKQDVARLLARILDFNEQEMRRSGIQLGSLNSLDHHKQHRRQSSTSSISSANAQDESFAQQFVHFLEEESKVHKVPVAKRLAQDLTLVVSPTEPIKTTNLISDKKIDCINFIRHTDSTIECECKFIEYAYSTANINATSAITNCW